MKTAITIGYSIDHTQRSKITTLHNQLSLTFEVSDSKEKSTISTNLFGNYNIENIAAAMAVAEYFSIPFKTMRGAIENYIPSNMRSQIIKTKKNNTVVLDAYNSNPFSLKEALEHFIKADVDNKIAIIGDMLELGDSSEEEHRAIVELSEKNTEIDFVFVGKEFKGVSNDKNAFYSNATDCVSQLKNKEIRDSNIFLKGSRGVALERLLPYL